MRDVNYYSMVIIISVMQPGLLRSVRGSIFLILRSDHASQTSVAMVTETWLDVLGRDQERKCSILVCQEEDSINFTLPFLLYH